MATNKPPQPPREVPRAANVVPMECATKACDRVCDPVWKSGMKDLAACCNAAEMSPAMAARRGQVYRKDLCHLTDAQWIHAVKVARRRRFFPSIEELQEFALETPAPVRPSLALLPAGDLEAAREEARETARKGLEWIKAELKRQGVDVDLMPELAKPITRKKR
jgi:hypothetical protein